MTDTTDIRRRGPVTLADLETQPTVSVEQAAHLLGVSRAYGYEMARKGWLPTITLGPKRVRVRSAGLLSMLTGE